MVCVHWLIETCAAGRLAAAFVVGSAARGCHSIEPLACKSWADRVPQCAPGASPRKIFGRDVGPSAVVEGRCYTLLHEGDPASGCWPAPTVKLFRRGADQSHLTIQGTSSVIAGYWSGCRSGMWRSGITGDPALRTSSTQRASK
jgi:hypothetical protein